MNTSKISSPERIDVLPCLSPTSSSTASISFRLLLSAKEAGCLIGKKGIVIDSIREETNTNAGISKLQQGSQERILTVNGKPGDVTRALSYFAQALVNSFDETQFSYPYFPLKKLSKVPFSEGKTTLLRLLIPNSQIGSLIGSHGKRIQEIQKMCKVSMIASKSLLPGSSERLVELQGTVDALYDVLNSISNCLIEELPSIKDTKFYVPRSHDKVDTHRELSNLSISFPNEVVGALIGKNGTRIQGVRKVSGAMIIISDVNEENERVFTLTGEWHAVEKAKDMLHSNLIREEQRRAYPDCSKDS
ncbi:hypothetical protein JCM33374_g574 [Metschnikowia sp. JCM 33374]|nr:hypothetical protein JCM33374_g574 [Metschnikowia sp. JCM 33374]